MFTHQQAAHCESGAASSLLTHHGLAISEPMAFGLASALSFAYLPFIKLSGLPLIAYRMPPRSIFKGLQKRIGIKMQYQTFGNADKGMDALDEALQQGKIVGLQTNVFWLPYFPDNLRFHFNAHNLLVFGKEGNDYLVSDPVADTLTRCDAASLKKARFAKGALAPKGLMYFPSSLPGEINYQQAAPKALLANYRIMTGTPLPIIGLRGIRFMGKKIKNLVHDGASDAQLKLYLTHIVRMQEEIGTGGAGFRFIYASFLQELSNILHSDLLSTASAQMTEAGDEWRNFAAQATRMCKNRREMDAALLDTILNECADKEQLAWNTIHHSIKQIKKHG